MTRTFNSNTSLTIFLALAVSLATAIRASASMTVTVDGELKLGATFEATNYQRTLFAVCGDLDLGEDVALWPYRESLVEVPAGATSVADVPLPVSVSGKAVRFYLQRSCSPLAYVQNGLVAQFDAKDNAGLGVHDPEATTWTDLKGNHSFYKMVGDEKVPLAPGDLTFADDHVLIPNGLQLRTDIDLSADSSKTAEIVAHTDDGCPANTSNKALVNLCGDGLVAFRGGEGDPITAIFVKNSDRIGYYVNTTVSSLDTRANTQQMMSYSLVLDPALSESSLKVAGETFFTGATASYYTAMSNHRDYMTVGLNAANQYTASLRIYSRALTDDERERNKTLDDWRFGLAVVESPVDISEPQTIERAPIVALTPTADGGYVADVEFPPSASIRDLYVVYGLVDSGSADLNAWDGFERLCTVASWTSAVKGIQLPFVAANASYLRFVLKEADDIASYIQDGLVAQFDAKDNAGLGVHDPEATTWTDLKGNHSFYKMVGDEKVPLAPGDLTFADDHVLIPNGLQLRTDIDLSADSSKTAEIVAHTDNDCPIDTSNKALVNLCGDGFVAFRGGEWDPIVAMFAKNSNRVGYYVNTTASSLNTRANTQQMMSYSLVLDPALSGSSLKVAGETFFTGATASYFTRTSSHCDYVTVGMNAANQYTATVRLYNRALTDSERTANLRIDELRYFGAKPVSVSTESIAIDHVASAAVDLKAKPVPTADLEFPASYQKRELVLAYGSEDFGGVLADWPRSVVVMTVPAGVGILRDIALPAPVGSVGKIRFFLRECADVGAYVQKGLVSHYDAIDNAGVGQHDPDAVNWKDLKGGAVFYKMVNDERAELAQGDLTFNSCDVLISKDFQLRADFPLAETDVKTAEVIARTDNGFDYSQTGTAPLIDLCHDGIVGFRGADTYRVVTQFVDNSDRRAYYMENTASAYNAAAETQKMHCYCGIFDPVASHSVLYVEGETFVAGTTGWFYKSPDASPFVHRDYSLVGLKRANEYTSALRVYNRRLTDAERAANLRVDHLRYFGATAESTVVGEACEGSRPGLMLIFR